MTYLLDTHIFIWLATDPERLPPSLLNVLRDRASSLVLSVASMWEIQIKRQLGKLKLPTSEAQFVATHQRLYDIATLPIYEHHVWMLSNLPLYHRDPFDRILVAQAIIEDYTLVSVDALFAPYPVRRLS